MMSSFRQSDEWDGRHPRGASDNCGGRAWMRWVRNWPEFQKESARRRESFRGGAKRSRDVMRCDGKSWV